MYASSAVSLAEGLLCEGVTSLRYCAASVQMHRNLFICIAAICVMSPTTYRMHQLYKDSDASRRCKCQENMAHCLSRYAR